MLQIAIKKADPVAHIIKNDKDIRIILLEGESSITAHYRLGVGLNNGFLALQELNTTLRSFHNLYGSKPLAINNIEQIEAIIANKNKEARQRIENLANFQVSTIFFEAYCNWIISVDPITGAQSIYEKVEKEFPDGTYLNLLNPESDLIKLCSTNSKNRIVNRN